METSYYGVTCIGCKGNIPLGHYQGGLRDRKSYFLRIEADCYSGASRSATRNTSTLRPYLVTFEGPEGTALPLTTKELVKSSFHLGLFRLLLRNAWLVNDSGFLHRTPLP